MTQCPNCSAELSDKYCPSCGQRRIEPEELSARRYLRDLADEVASFRKQYKTLRTLRGLLTPGWLTAEYLAGRRRRYISPLQLYLVCAATFFLSAPVAGFTLASLIEADRSGTLKGLVSARAAERGLEPLEVKARFDVRVQSVYTITFGAIAFVFGLLLQLLYLKQDRPYGAHLVFAMHFVSFMYLLAVLAGVGRRLGLSTDVAAAIGYALILPYLYFALKRVYTESTRATLLKTATLVVLTVLLNFVANFGAIRATLALV